MRDADGHFWLVGPTYDGIKSAGRLIGPFEVGRVLMEHPTVAEAGVISRRDPSAGGSSRRSLASNPVTLRATPLPASSRVMMPTNA